MRTTTSDPFNPPYIQHKSRRDYLRSTQHVVTDTAPRVVFGNRSLAEPKALW